MAVISDATRLFQLERGLSASKEITDDLINEIKRLDYLSVPGLLMDVPKEWRESKAFFSSRVFADERLCPGEMVVDFLVRVVVSDALDRLKELVEEDLARVLYHIVKNQGWFRADNQKPKNLRREYRPAMLSIGLDNE